jgi:hypothetical protein
VKDRARFHYRCRAVALFHFQTPQRRIYVGVSAGMNATKETTRKHYRPVSLLPATRVIRQDFSGYQTNSSSRNKQHVVYTTLCCWLASARVSWKPSGFACVGTGCVSVVPSTVDSATLPSSTGFSATGLATPSRVRACVDFGPYASMCASECHSK